jgi:hypothetical protein
MTQDEIIRMALAADIDADAEGLTQPLERFAALVAEATKEKAAKVCDEMATPATSIEIQSDFHWAAGCCAAAIRSMK